MKWTVVRFLPFLFLASCGPQTDNENKEEETMLDKNPGIQDVVLGNQVDTYKDRITYKDNFVGGSDETALYFIELKKAIANECRGNANTVRVTTYQGKIMSISMNIWCSGIKDMLVNKFGEPSQSFGDSYVWKGARNSLRLVNTGEHYGYGKPSYDIIMESDVVIKSFKKSRKGNF